MYESAFREKFYRDLRLISNHPQVCGINPHGNSVDVTFSVNLPSEWRRDGISPSGVKVSEVVRFDFPVEYPLLPPILSLRSDFNRNFPHILPWLTKDGRPVPCIWDGDIAELLHKEGLIGIVNQTVTWLHQAGIDSLIDPQQGWEPVRRDSLDNTIVLDAADLRRSTKRSSGHNFLKLLYLRKTSVKAPEFIRGQILSGQVGINKKNIAELIYETNVTNEYCYGKSLALTVWPGKLPSGEPYICNTYFPETVNDLSSIKDRASLYGCANELISGLKWLENCLLGYQYEHPLLVAIILFARRPITVIGSESNIELCPYIAEFRLPHSFTKGKAIVRPAAQHHMISRNLLTRISGIETTNAPPKWALVGAGSLGSKIALHLARAGSGPNIVVDKSNMTPHNAARHALVPNIADMQIAWLDAKARLLVAALNGFNQDATPITQERLIPLSPQPQYIDFRRAGLFGPRIRLN